MHRYAYTENIHALPCELIIQTSKFLLQITHPVPAYTYNGLYWVAAGYAALSVLHEFHCRFSLAPNYMCISSQTKGGLNHSF